MGINAISACVKCVGLHPNSILRKNIATEVRHTQKGKDLRAVQIQVCIPSLWDAKVHVLGQVT